LPTATERHAPFGKRLTERQDAEITIYNRVKDDIENAKL
jgi:hypothetical protein